LDDLSQRIGPPRKYRRRITAECGFLYGFFVGGGGTLPLLLHHHLLFALLIVRTVVVYSLITSLLNGSDVIVD
jgi:hypothetical protein